MKETNKSEQNSPVSPEDQERQKIYEELQGYFPAQYDLMPQELEASIRRRKGMYDAHRAENTAQTFSRAAADRVKQLQNTPPAAEKDMLDAFLPKEEAASKTPLVRFLREAFDILEVFVLCAACIILVFAFFGRLTRVDGISMNDTLKDKEFLIISDLFYTPRQGDIVVLHNTSLGVQQLREPLVKRIIAVGGQTVQIDADGTVTITDADGTAQVLDETYVKAEPFNGEPLKCYVPEGYIFVMGDNRNHSTDSRDPQVGLFDERCVCGRAVLRVFPFSAFTVFQPPLEGTN